MVYARIRVRGEKRMDDSTPTPVPFRPLEPFMVLVRDGRFRSYMTDMFIFGLANLILNPVVPIVLRDDLHANFREMQLTTVIVPYAMGILTVGLWGRVLDRSNPMVMRGYMNLVWALLPLAYFLTPRSPVQIGPLTISPLLFIWTGAVLQGAVAAGQGLVWTLGAMYFARKEDVPLYQGVHIGLTGLRSLGGAFLGPMLVGLMGGGPEARRMLFLAMCLAMIVSGLLMLRLAAKMRREMGGRLLSFAEREEQAEQEAASTIAIK
jgi:hypothetical protein